MVWTAAQRVGAAANASSMRPGLALGNSPELLTNSVSLKEVVRSLSRSGYPSAPSEALAALVISPCKSVVPLVYLTRVVRRLVYRAIASKSRSLCQTGMRLSIAMAAMRQSVEERTVYPFARPKR